MNQIISGYKFVPLDNLNPLHRQLKQQTEQLGLLGTILLSEEGINANLYGDEDALQSFCHELKADARFADMTFKTAPVDEAPFHELLVKIKPHIITMRGEAVKPWEKTGDYLTPRELKTWLDEKRPIVMVDTRNDFEVQCGTFEGAMNLRIKNFTEFSKAIEALPEEMKEQPIVTFCTGGIRCEKATAVMLNKGFKKVYQLQGGILQYFMDCGAAHYQGECFVFDDRISVGADLKPVGRQQRVD